MRGVKVPIKAFKIKVEEEFVQTYPSIAGAANALGLNDSDIAKVLKGDRNKVGSYTFRKI